MRLNRIPPTGRTRAPSSVLVPPVLLLPIGQPGASALSARRFPILRSPELQHGWPLCNIGFLVRGRLPRCSCRLIREARESVPLKCKLHGVQNRLLPACAVGWLHARQVGEVRDGVVDAAVAHPARCRFPTTAAARQILQPGLCRPRKELARDWLTLLIEYSQQSTENKLRLFPGFAVTPGFFNGELCIELDTQRLLAEAATDLVTLPFAEVRAVARRGCACGFV